MTMWPLTLTGIYIVGYIGYRLFRRLHIPSSSLLGSMLSVGIVTACGVPWTDLPSYIKILMQIIIGITIGLRFSKDRLQDIKSLIIPGSLATSWMMASGLGTGFLLYNFFNIDLGTALFSAVPAGIAEMSAIALSYNLNVSIVLLFQLLRVVGALIVIPVIASKYHRSAAPAPPKEVPLKKSPKKKENIYLTLILGGLSGFGLWYINIPAGAIIGPMIAIGFLRFIDFPLKPMSSRMIVFAQIGIGGTLGSSFTPDVFDALGKILLPAILFSFAIIASSIILGLVIHKLFGWDITTSLLSCAPAGVTQMSIVALEMNSDPIKVGLMHIVRLSTIVILIPPYILWISGY